MIKFKSPIGAVGFLFAIAFSLQSFAQEPSIKSTNAPSTNAPARRPSAARASKQAEAASPTAKFGDVSGSDETYKSALDAHLLADALKLSGKPGAFKGTVTAVFEPRNVAILNFDADYRAAISAIVQGTNFSKFPALTNLIGKNVVVTGTFSNYQGRAEIVLTNPQQIKVMAGEIK